MIKSWLRAFIGLALFVGVLAPATAAQAQAWQCAPFARMFSGIQLFGNAATWWDKALGKYTRGQLPEIGSVMVFKAHGAMRVGHVATVSKVVSDRVIKVTHANWSIINGRRGQVENDVQVIDVSEKNDWSKVRVWYAPLQDLGRTAYPVYGFIYGKDAAENTEVNSALASNKADTATAAASHQADKPAETALVRLALPAFAS